MGAKADKQLFIRGAKIQCIETLGIEPTEQQIKEALAYIDNQSEKADGIFMYGFELAQRTIKIVAEENGIKAEEYELKPKEKKRVKQ